MVRMDLSLNKILKTREAGIFMAPGRPEFEKRTSLSDHRVLLEGYESLFSRNHTIYLACGPALQQGRRLVLQGAVPVFHDGRLDIALREDEYEHT